MWERSAGILLHPTSLPGRFGVGDLGGEADRFFDWLAAAGQTWWQILPLGPPDGFHSPYSCLSVFAGHALLISPELLVADGLLAGEEIAGAPEGREGRVDFPAVTAWKEPLLRRAWERFRSRPGCEMRQASEAFQAAPEQSWLADWTLFAALRRHYDGRGWWDWDPAVARREPEALAAARHRLADEVAYHGFVQFLFFRQWDRVRREARRRGIRILGDLPIYVAWNSAEVWARPELFDLDEAGRPRTVAGVPPDYFSETGQLWGNPLYRWDRMADDDYAWWTLRLAADLRLADLVRLDHFRAFASFWQVDAGEETAVDGRWVEGPGTALFDALREALGDDLPIVAEDLGDITPDVEALQAALDVPGMRVLQFGFEDPHSIHAVHNFTRRSVAYTGTHDNDTSRGWYGGLDAEAKDKIGDYCGCSDEDSLHLDLIRLLYTSVADLAVVPMQDVLGLDGSARMNTPAVAEGNWSWRLCVDELRDDLARGLRRLAALSGRTEKKKA